MEAETRTYNAIIGRDSECFYATIPELPSCFADGETIDKVMKKIAEVAGLSYRHAIKYGFGSGEHGDERYFAGLGIHVIDRRPVVFHMLPVE